MIYAWFTLWLFLMIFAGMGVYRLLSKLTSPGVANWALLPGTIVSEMAYIFGCLIAGGEIKSAKIMPQEKGEGEAATQAQPKLKIVGPLVASLLAIVACGSAILGARALLGSSVIDTVVGEGENRHVALAGAPTGAAPATATAEGHKKKADSAQDVADAFWGQLEYQIKILRRMTETLGNLNWKNWKVPLFVYLSICLTVRLSPTTRPIRPTLGAVVLVATVIAILGLLWKRFDGLMNNLWPLLTYCWGILLLVLVAMLVLAGVVALVRALAGKPAKAGK